MKTKGKCSMTLRDGSPISDIALGTMYMGSRISEVQSRRLLDTFFDLGGNQIDTARCYAGWLEGGAGASERTVGGWLASQKREAVFLGTKGGIMPRGFNATRGDLSRKNIESDLKTSLKTLGTEYIDLYWLHRDDYHFEAGEIMEMMNDFVKEGIIRYFGVSNWSVERIRQAQSYAAARGLQGISASQIQYGLGVCTPQDWGDASIVCMNQKEYEGYRELEMPVYAYSAQAEGYFSILLEKGEDALSDDTRGKYDTPVNRKRAARLAELYEKRGIDLSWVMAEYVLRSPFPAVFILGGSNERRMKHMMEKRKQGVRELTEEEWSYLIDS